VRASASRLVAGFCARHPGVQASLHVGEREELLERLAAGADDLYLFVLEIEGLPAHRRWSIAHPKGAPSEVSALFLREAVLGAVPGIEGVAQSVAEQIERENQQKDG
jgi:hypothetical protein